MSQPSWRLANHADAPFFYRLVCAVDPRWWRFTRYGTAPADVVAQLSAVTAAAVVLVEGEPVAGAMLSAGGSAGTGTVEFHALPEPAAEEAARATAPDLVRAAMEGSGLRRLYRDHFSDDPDLFGGFSAEWTREVTMPRFTTIGGRTVDRHISVTTPAAVAAWVASPTAAP